MRVTIDTNTVISGLFWKGNPRKVLDAARDGIIEIFTTSDLLLELEEVLMRERFANRLAAAETAAADLVSGFAALASVVEPLPLGVVISRDPDDDAVLACALSSECDLIVSGDDDLLVLGEFRGIQILNSSTFVKVLNL